MNKLMIIGASGQGKVIADIALNCGYEEIAFLDDNPDVKSCLGFPVVGALSDVDQFADADFVVAIGNPQTRKSIQTELTDEGIHVVSLIHPDAVIGKDVKIEKGTVVMAGTVINPDSAIGEGCIINTGATVDHDNQIEDYVHVSVGSHLAGTVSVGQDTWIGAGATVSNNIHICGGVMIGAGAVVVHDISEPGTYIGVPAIRQEVEVKEADTMTESLISESKWGGVENKVEKPSKQLNIEYKLYPVQLSMPVESEVA